MEFRSVRILGAVTIFLALYYNSRVTCLTFYRIGSSPIQAEISHQALYQATFSWVAGNNARTGQFPWMAVVHQLLGNFKIRICGGTIISARWVLTAGHCVAKRPRIFYVVFGEVDKSNIYYNSYQGRGMAMTTTKGAIHPQYRGTVNDVALLFMPRDITFSATIQPIRLAGIDEEHESFAGKVATLIGWGRDGITDRDQKALRYGAIPIISVGECRWIWNDIRDDSVMCTAAGTGVDACQGDSGGPLVVSINGEYLQVGIVSYGDNDCPSSIPGVFTRISWFNNWIRRITGIQY